MNQFTYHKTFGFVYVIEHRRLVHHSSLSLNISNKNISFQRSENQIIDEELITKLSKQKYMLFLSFYQTINQFYETISWLQRDVSQIMKNNSINKLNSKLVISKSLFTSIFLETKYDYNYQYKLNNEMKYILVYFQKIYNKFSDSCKKYLIQLSEQVYFFRNVLEMKEDYKNLENKTIVFEQERNENIDEKLFGKFLMNVQIQKEEQLNLNAITIEEKTNIMIQKINKIYNEPLSFIEGAIEQLTSEQYYYNR